MMFIIYRYYLLYSTGRYNIYQEILLPREWFCQVFNTISCRKFYDT